jgi:exosortase
MDRVARAAALAQFADPTLRIWYPGAVRRRGAAHGGDAGRGGFSSNRSHCLSLSPELFYASEALFRAWIFPLLLLVFMLPKLALVYNQVTLPLQLLAKRIAAGMLSQAGFSVIREGNILDVHGHRLSVVEACNGIRCLLPLAFLAVVFAYVARARLWIGSALLAATVPVAILGNGLRVAVSASLPALAQGAPHMLAGAAIFLLCLGVLAAIQRLLCSFHARPA